MREPSLEEQMEYIRECRELEQSQKAAGNAEGEKSDRESVEAVENYPCGDGSR